MKLKILGQEPAFFVGVLEAALALALTLNLFVGLDQNEAAVIVATANAALGLVVAYAARDTLYAALIGFTKALLVLGATFGLQLSDQTTGAVMALITLVAGAYLRGQTGSTDTAISSASPGVKKEALELMHLAEAATMRDQYFGRPVQPSGESMPDDVRRRFARE